MYSLVCCIGWSSASDILHAYDIQAYLSNPLEQLRQISIKGEMLMSTRVASSLSIHMRRKFAHAVLQAIHTKLPAGEM